MLQNKRGAAKVMSVLLLAALGAARQATAQETAATYPKMAPVGQYLMANRDAEIALARSAAPESISRDATILVLGRQGYETAVQGKNGFVCYVGRSWGAAFDWSELWNPRIRAAACLNPQAARAMLPIDRLRARMVMAGRSNAQIVSALKAAFAGKQLPDLASGAMSYMMSKSSYLTDQGDHDMPHVMFYTHLKDGKDWGSGAAGSPVMSSPYWYFLPENEPRAKGLPSILVFLVAVPQWSDGTPASQHDHQERGADPAR